MGGIFLKNYYDPFYRGVRTTIKDGGGLTALERRMELGAITDEDLFILFVRYGRGGTL